MSSFTTEAFTLLGIGLSLIFLRLYARIRKGGVASFRADDYLMLAAAVVYSAETTLAYTVGAYWLGLANSGMTDAERAALSPLSEEYRLRVNGSKTQVAGWSTYTLLLWLLKASMCTFYLRLTDGLDYRVRIYAGFVVIGVTWLTVLLSILLSCTPMHKNWQINPDPGNHCQPAISKVDIFVTVVLNVSTDLYLMSIPLPMLWKAHLRPIKKLGLMVLFSGGIFVTMAGILRCVLILTNPVTGAEQAGSWAVRETFVAVVTSNLPMLVPLIAPLFRRSDGRTRGPLLLRRVFRRLAGGSSSGSRNQRNGGGGGGGDPKSSSGRSGPGMFVLEDKNPRRGMGPRSVHPIPQMTLSESEENIYRANLEQEQEQQEQQENDLEHDQHDQHVQRGHSQRHRRQRSAAAAAQQQSSSPSPSPPPQTGITKQVVLHISEHARRSDGGGSELSSLDAVDGVAGARRGNYYLTERM